MYEVWRYKFRKKGWQDICEEDDRFRDIWPHEIKSSGEDDNV
jgi:hypothetical protein